MDHWKRPETANAVRGVSHVRQIPTPLLNATLTLRAHQAHGRHSPVRRLPMRVQPSYGIAALVRLAWRSS